MHARIHHGRLSYRVMQYTDAICFLDIFDISIPFRGPQVPCQTLLSPKTMKPLQGESASAFCHWFGDPTSLFVFVAWRLLAAQVDEGVARSCHRLPLALGGSRSCSSDDGSTSDQSGIEQISGQTCGCPKGGIQLCLWFARWAEKWKGWKCGTRGVSCLMLFVFLGLGWVSYNI